MRIKGDKAWRVVSDLDIANIISALEKIPDSERNGRFISFSISHNLRRESVGVSKQLRAKFKKLDYFLHSEVRLYFYQVEAIEKNYEVLPERIYGHRHIRIYDLPGLFAE